MTQTPKKQSRSTKTIVLSLGMVLSSLGALVLSAVLSRMFDKADYSTYKQSLLVFALMAPLLSLGLSNALMYYLPTSLKKTRAIMSENLGLVLLISSGIALFIVCGGNHLLARIFKNPALGVTLLILIPFMFGRAILGTVSPFLVATERTGIAAIFSVASRLGVVVAVLLTVYFLPTPFAALAANSISIAVVASVAIFMMWCLSTGSFTPTVTGAMEQFKFGVPLGLSSLISQLNKRLDQVMVSSMTNLDEFAVYTNGAVELPLIGAVTGSMNSVLLVDYRKLLEENKTREVLRLLHRAAVKSGTVLIPVMFLLLCVAPEFMTCLYGEKYTASANVFRVYLLLLPIRTLVFSSVALAAGYTKALSVIPIVSLVANAVFNYFGVKIFGAIGATWASVITIYLVGAYGRALIAQHILGCRMVDFLPWSETLKLMSAAAVATPLVLLVKAQLGMLTPFLVLPICSCIYIVLTVPILIYLGFVDQRKVIARATEMLNKVRRK